METPLGVDAAKIKQNFGTCIQVLQFMNIVIVLQCTVHAVQI